MKKFFKPREAGTITPLPPTSPAASSSSFGTPRPFDEYQARMAAQAEHSDLQRPLSYQPPSSKSRSRPPRGSSDEAAFAQPYPPNNRHSQHFGPSDAVTFHRSPDKQRHSNQFHSMRGVEVPYDSYSDPNSHPSEHTSTRASYDRSRASDRDKRASQPVPYAAPRNSFQSKHSSDRMAAFSPPRSLRPANQPPRQRPVDGLGASSDRQPEPGRFGTTDHVAFDPSRVRRRKSDEDESDSDADESSPASRGPSRVAAYPVYSGADGGQDDAEVLISQGRYEETTLTELKDKDKPKTKKLFAFASAAKDKKAKQSREKDRDRALASSPLPPMSSRDRDDGQLLSPPSDSPMEAHQERAKEGGWMDRWNKRAHQQHAARLQDKEAEELAGSRVGWLSANAVQDQDWMEILPLIDMVSQSDAASKEAARALRKEFKYGSVDAQRRAVRTWALLTLNATDRFRQHVASKRFLDAVEDTVASSKTPLSVKETMLRVLGVLAFEFRDEPELAAITKCWNRVKPSDRPKDGEALENDLVEFRLPQQRASPPPGQRAAPYAGHSTHPQAYNAHLAVTDGWHAPPQSIAPPQAPQHRAGQDVGAHQAAAYEARSWAPWSAPAAPAPPPAREHRRNEAHDVVSNLEALAAESMERRSTSLQGSDASCRTPNEVVTQEEDMRRLHEECHIARSNASVLMDTLVHEGLHAETAELVDEFYQKVARSQELLASQIGWASAQADRSRTRGPLTGETRQEALLADILEAHGRASEAVGMVDDARRHMDEEEQERQVTERSKVEVSIDRAAMAQDAHTGDLYELGAGRGRGLLGADLGARASGSRSPSPNAGVSGVWSNAVLATSPVGGAVRVSRPLPVPRSEPSSDSNSVRSGMHASAPAPTHSRDTSVSSHHTPPSTLRSQLPIPPPALSISTHEPPLPPRPGAGRKEQDDEEMQTPVVPSAKALGKRRAVSVRYPSPPASGQAALANGIDSLRIGH